MLVNPGLIIFKNRKINFEHKVILRIQEEEDENSMLELLEFIPYLRSSFVGSVYNRSGPVKE